MFFWFAATRGTHTTKAAAAAAAAVAVAAAAVALAVARAATTLKTWPRSTPKITETGDASRCASPWTIQTAFFFFWSDFFFGPMDALLAACPFLCQFFRAGVVTVPSFYIFANHSAVSQPHPRKGAGTYCCIQAGGILAATEVCCAGCTPLCAGRCARRLFVLLVVPCLLLS